MLGPLVDVAPRVGESEMCSCEIEARSSRCFGSWEAISSDEIDEFLDLDLSRGYMRGDRDEMRARAVEIRSISGDCLPAGADASRLLEETTTQG